MTKLDFLKQLEEDLEITSISLTENTAINQIDEWDSLASMTTLAIIDEHFGLDIDISKMNNLETIGDIFNIIGEENFEAASPV